MFRKMVRIFLSSTFYNFKDERDELVSVFRELGEYCKSEGFSFQVLDLRWGISDEEGQNNRTLQICFDEIARCQMLSPKPNFLILSGLYYGWIPLPYVIAERVWNKIENEIPVKSILRNWYLQDKNDIEQPYILRARKDGEKGRTEWGAIEASLKKELFPLIRKHFPDERKWFDISGLSATEQEIYKGLFCHPENKEHTFVLMRTKEPANCTKREESEETKRAVALQAHLNEYMGTLKESNVLMYRPGDEYLQKVKTFLRQVIQSRVAEVRIQEQSLTLFQREQCLLNETVWQAERDYIDVNNEDGFLDFCESNSGRIILLMGESGSGKSTLLRHCYNIKHENFVLSSADILPSCSNIAHALWFCLKQIQGKSAIADIETESDAEHCVAWFERQVVNFNSNTPITILLDSVDQISDWNQIGGSLLTCKLPRGLTLVISCISEMSLNERDRKNNICCYRLCPIVKQDSICMLKQLLRNRGRILSEEDEKFIQEGIKKDVTPLYVEMLCRQLQNRRSFARGAFVLPAGTRESIRTHLEGLIPVFARTYYHIIGYLALAVDGLSEQELLILLEQDIEVLKEIKQYSHWEIKQNYFTISVFWSRIHYELKKYLSEVDSNGILLLRFHHDLIRQTVKEMVGETELMELSKIMGNYFKSEPVYLNCTRDNIIVNTRKLRELLPALRYQNDWFAIAEVLAAPYYTDGYLRCGWYREIMQQFAELGQHGYLYDVHRRMVSLLQDKAMLFQLWGDSFLPAVLEMDIYSYAKTEIYWQHVLRYHSKSLTHKKNGEGKILITNASNMKIAVKNDGTLAILEGAVLKRYDLDLRSEIYPRCYIDTENASLYWQGENLIVRDEYSRIWFEDTGKELVQVKIEKCCSRTDLFSDDVNKIIHAGGFTERDSIDYLSHTIFKYHSNGMLKRTELFYADVEDIRCFCHGFLCAVLLNQCKLDIIDLDQRLLLASYTVLNACHAYWNEQGTEILVTFEKDKVQKFSYNYDNSIPLENHYKSMESYIKGYKKRVGRKEVLEIMQISCPVNGKDTPAYAGSILGSRRPLYAAFSIKGDRLACYYYYLNQGIIRLFRLDGRELLAESTVDPVFWNDSVGRPIYFNEDGSVLVLISRGKRHFWRMDTLKWVHHGKRPADSYTEMKVNLKEKYFNTVKTLLPVGNSKKFMTNINIGKIVRKVMLLAFSPLVCSKNIDRDNDMLLCESMRQVSVVESGGFWWIVDRHHSMIHVCDQEGHWVCHEQLHEEIFDFNVIGCTVYVLPIDLSDPIQLDMISVQ